jgi:hypothetical protein
MSSVQVGERLVCHLVVARLGRFSARRRRSSAMMAGCAAPVRASGGIEYVRCAVLRLLPMSDREKDAEILALRHQVRILQRQLGGQRVRFSPEDRRCWRRCSARCRAARCAGFSWP